MERGRAADKMAIENLFNLFLHPINRIGIRYMVTGAAASIIYGEPRLTNDLDLVLEIGEADIASFVEHFPLEDFYCPPPEVIQIEARRAFRGHFNVIHHKTGFKADIYTFGNDELHRWGMAKRRRYSIGEEEIWVAPPEYVIIRKLEYYREGGSDKHLSDIAGILENSSDEIDRAELEQKIQSLGLAKEWNRLHARSKLENLDR